MRFQVRLGEEDLRLGEAETGIVGPSGSPRQTDLCLGKGVLG